MILNFLNKSPWHLTPVRLSISQTVWIWALVLNEILQSFCFWIREWSYFDGKCASENTLSYSVFTTFDVDLRKALCDGTWFVERAHIANTKSNIDQFSNRFSTFCLQKRYHWYSCNHFCHFLTFPISLSVIRFLANNSN